MTLRNLKDLIISKALGGLTSLSCLTVFLILFALFIKARPILELKSIGHLLLSSDWRPLDGHFGFYPFILGTLWVTALAMLIAVPLSILSAIYLSEYAGKKVRDIFRSLIDLLSGIPSVIFGAWGVLVIVPLIKDVIGPAFGVRTSGYTVLAAGIVLAIMVYPLITSILGEVFSSIPAELRNASLALGATKWQTIKHTVLRKAMPGIFAAVILGFSRAFGETMAVLMVAGNVAKAPGGIFDPAYPLPALIANNYGEMMSVPMYDSAILFAALILLLTVLLFNVAARLVLTRIEQRSM